MALSGAAGLGYQIVWTRQCAVWVGQEAAALLAVIAALFGGMALGAAFGAGLARASARRGLACYAACEALIAAWATVLLMLMPAWGAAMQAAIGLSPAATWQWSVTFVGTAGLLLPASLAMGATLPAVAQVLRREARDRDAQGAGVDAVTSLALPYAANTFGAVLGVLGAAYALLPAWGATSTALVCIALNAGGAILAWRWRGRAAGPDAPAITRPPPQAPGAAVRRPDSPLSSHANGPGAAALGESPAPSARADLARLAATGLLGIGYEVLVVRVLGQLGEGTVYTYANLLAVYLVGTSLGAAWLARRPSAGSVDGLLVALAAACLAGCGTLRVAGWLHATLLGDGGGMGTALALEAGLALLAFGAPTFMMGALFARLCERVAGAHGTPCALCTPVSATAAARRPHGPWRRTASYGAALAANTAGAALAPALFGVALVPVLGPGRALMGISLGYLALVSRHRWRPWKFTRTSTGFGAVLVAALALAAFAPPLRFVQVPAGGRLLDYREGVTAAVSVVEDADGRTARLRIDNRQQEGSNASRYADARQAWLPLLLHPAPRRALFLGLGTGVSAASAAVDPGLQVTAVELLPEVIAAAPRFVAPIGGGRAGERLEIVAADARRYVATAPGRWDVIVSDNFHPARSGSAALYTAEHFEAVRRRLATGGVFCQWLPLHQLDRETLRSIVAAFRVAFPGGAAMLATLSLETPVLGLVGSADGHRFDPAALRPSRFAPDHAEGPADFGLDDERAVYGSFVAGPRALARLAGEAPPNTDDRPVVAWLAPRATYAPEASPGERLLALLAESAIDPDEVVADDGTAASRARLTRLAAWRAARDRFLVAGLAVRPSADPRAMLAQVRQPLLEVLDLSPDFEPARRPLERLAEALAASDPVAAAALRAELAQRRRVE